VQNSNVDPQETLTTDELPEKLTLRLEFDMDREWALEMFNEESDGFGTMSLQKFINSLRNSAAELIKDDMFNLIQSAKIVDENENVVFEEDPDATWEVTGI
jgi:hypothetical protein